MGIADRMAYGKFLMDISNVQCCVLFFEMFGFSKRNIFLFHIGLSEERNLLVQHHINETHPYSKNPSIRKLNNYSLLQYNTILISFNSSLNYLVSINPIQSSFVIFTLK